MLIYGKFMDQYTVSPVKGSQVGDDVKGRMLLPVSEDRVGFHGFSRWKLPVFVCFHSMTVST